MKTEAIEDTKPPRGLVANGAPTFTTTTRRGGGTDGEVEVEEDLKRLLSTANQELPHDLFDSC